MSRLDSLMQHPQANSDSATYRRSDRSSPRPELDDGMPYNHRRMSVKADEMASEDTQLTSRAPNSDGTPQRPMNVFMIFAHRRRLQVSAANQTMHTGDISKILSKEWNSMDMLQQPRYAPPPGPPPPCRPRPASTSSGAGSTAPPASDGWPNVGTNLTTLTHRQCLGQQLNEIDTDRFAFITSTADALTSAEPLSTMCVNIISFSLLNTCVHGTTVCNALCQGPLALTPVPLHPLFVISDNFPPSQPLSRLHCIMANSVQNSAKVFAQRPKKLNKSTTASTHSMRSHSSMVSTSDNENVDHSNEPSTDSHGNGSGPDIELTPEEELNALQQHWCSPIYTFFKSDVTFQSNDGRPSHFFTCATSK
ncbi:hypothetical protein F5888DRAFT_1878358 [Russula emetica]|nr:hypothetical protein F5888DRAFT_1878358 [Russula emetica]